MKGGFPPGELMKRTSHKKYGTFKDILPLTKWCFCMKCRMEVSREPLWELLHRIISRSSIFAKNVLLLVNTFRDSLKQYLSYMLLNNK